MRGGKLEVRRVRRYRVARYPSRHRSARRAGSLGSRALRAAAAPAVALGLGVAGGACDGGVNLVGEDLDVPDAVEAVPDVAEAGDEAAPDAADEATPDTDESDSMIAGGRPEGVHYVRFLSEAEGRTLVAETVAETASPDDPCAEPVLAERVVEDGEFFYRDGADTSGAFVNVDLLASEVWVEETPECAGGRRPAVGFEFATADAGDDEDVSGDRNGVTAAEEAYLAALRERGVAAISVLQALDYPYDVWDYGGTIDDSGRAAAEERVREAVRGILDDLRRDGLI
jgi:hypothetical protein